MKQANKREPKGDSSNERAARKSSSAQDENARSTGRSTSGAQNGSRKKK